MPVVRKMKYLLLQRFYFLHIQVKKETVSVYQDENLNPKQDLTKSWLTLRVFFCNTNVTTQAVKSESMSKGQFKSRKESWHGVAWSVQWGGGG